MKSSSDLTSASGPHETVGTHAAIGAQHLEGGRLEEAEASYHKALEIDPDFAEAHFKLGNIAMKLHRKIRWDPKQEQILGDDEAAKMLSRPMRAPWTL